jgi:hypothetical protein
MHAEEGSAFALRRELPALHVRWLLRRTKPGAHKVFRNSISSGSLFENCSRGSVMFQVGIQEVQRIERNPGVARVNASRP